MHAVGNLRQSHADLPLGVVQQLLHAGGDSSGAVAGAHILHPLHALAVAGKLGVQVSPADVVDPAVEEDEVEDVLHQLPLLENLHRGIRMPSA